MAILSILGLWPWSGTEPEEIDEGVAEVVLNLQGDGSSPFPPVFPPSEVSRREASLLPAPFGPTLDDPFRCFVFLSKVTRSGLLALPGDLYIDRLLT